MRCALLNVCLGSQTGQSSKIDEEPSGITDFVAVSTERKLVLYLYNDITLRSKLYSPVLRPAHFN